MESLVEASLGLSPDSRAILVERIMATLAQEIDPAIEQIHLEEVRKRQEAVQAGASKLFDVPQAMRRVEVALRK